MEQDRMDPVSEWFGGDAPELVLQRALGRPVRIERLVPGPVRQDRRALFRATLSGGEVVGVKFRRRRLRQVFDDWRRLSAGPGGFRVPAPIGLVEPPGCIVFRWEEGRRLIDTLRSEGEGAAWAGMAGRALVALHDSAVRLARRFTARDEVRTLDRWVRRAREMEHPRGDDLLAGVSEVQSRIAVDEGPLTTGHRDFYPFQVLATEPPTLLDLDEVAACEVALDAGNFAAHLAVDGLSHRIEPFVAAALGSDAVLRRREAFYRRSAFLRLSSVYWVRGDGERALSVPLD